jgi:hypothetical protein
VKQGKYSPPPQEPPLYAASLQLSPQFSLDFGNLEEKIGLQKPVKQELKKPEKRHNKLTSEDLLQKVLASFLLWEFFAAPLSIWK